MSTITQDIRPYDVETRRNLVPNPSGRFTLTGYTALGPGSIGQDAGQDTYWQASSVLAAGNCGIRIHRFTVGTDLTAGASYILSVDLLAVSGFAAQAWVLGGSGGASAVVGLAAGWTRVSVAFTAGANGTNVDIYMLNGSTSTIGGVIAFRDVLVETGSTVAPYFYGGTADTTTTRYDWLGATNNSQSVAMARDAATDPATPTLVLGEGFHTDRTPGTIVHGLLDGGSSAITLRAAGLRKGTLSYLFTDRAEANRTEQMHANPSTFTLDWPELLGTLKYVPGPGEISLNLHAPTGHLILEVPFQEVA